MKSKFWLSAGLLLSIALSGCASKQTEELRYFWPALPSEPHMEWLGTYASQNDFKKTEAEKQLEKFIGAQQPYVFQKPTGIAGDSERGIVYITDGEYKNIRVYDFNKKTVEFLSKESVGRYPTGIALDSKQNLYVCDAMGHTVSILTSSGKLVKKFGTELIKKAAHLALNEELNRVYVTDSLAHAVHVFDLQGKHLFSFGEKGAGEDQLYVPQGITIGKDHKVYIADQLNARVQIFDADGNHISRFGKRGDAAWHFEAPRDLMFDSDGNLWVVDARKNAIAIYDTTGQLLMYFNAGKRRTHPMSLGFPNAIWIDKNDRVYVSDLVHRRFQEWQYFSSSYKNRNPLTEADKARQLEILREKQSRDAN